MPQSSRPPRTSGRVVGRRGGPFGVARLPERKREHQLREAALPRSRCVRGERDRAFPGHERRVEIELFRCDVAEVGELLDPQLHRGVVVRGGEGELEEAPPLGDAIGRERSTNPTCRAGLRRQGLALRVRGRAQPRDCRSPARGGVASEAIRGRAAQRAPRRRVPRSARRALFERRLARRSRRDARARTPEPCRACRSGRRRRRTTPTRSTCRRAPQRDTRRSTR